MKRQQFDTVKIGMKVGVAYRHRQLPQNNQGTIAAKIEDWPGFHLNVHGDNGNQVSIKKSRINAMAVISLWTDTRQVRTLGSISWMRR